VIHSEKIDKCYGSRRYFVRLDSATSADAALGLILRELGLTLRGDPLQDLCAILEQGRALLVLDNLETPWENEEKETEALLAVLTAVPQLALVVSLRGQRRPGAVAWHEPILVDSLDGSAAADTFCKIAGKNHRSDPALHSLLAPLAGVPLAITLLAGAAEGNDLENVLCEWQSRRTAMLSEWEASLKLSMASKRMTPEARRLGALVAALPDGIAQRELEALMPGAGAQAAGKLAQVGLSSFESGRLRMLAPVREYLAQTHPPSEEDLNRAMKYYGDLARAWSAAAGRKAGVGAGARLVPEMANIDAMIRRGIETENVAWWIDTTFALTDFALFSGRTSPLPLDRALEAAHKAGDTLREVHCIWSLGIILLDCRRYDEAKSHFERALAIYRELGGGEVIGEASCIHSLGDIAVYCSRHDEARTCFETAVTLYRGIGDILGEANCLQSLGTIAAEDRRHDDAQTWFEAALTLYWEAGQVVGKGNCRMGLGHIALDRSRHDEARACFEAALELYGQAGSVLGEASCIQGLGNLALHRSQMKEAQVHLGKALLFYRRTGSVLGEVNCIQALGDIVLSFSQHEDARVRFEEALQLYRRIPEPYSIGMAERRLARLAADPVLRRQRIEAARAEWTKIARQDLVTELDREFGLP
jgi:tetratricopeptide (TPR) repeat protein